MGVSINLKFVLRNGRLYVGNLIGKSLMFLDCVHSKFFLLKTCRHDC